MELYPTSSVGDHMHVCGAVINAEHLHQDAVKLVHTQQTDFR